MRPVLSGEVGDDQPAIACSFSSMNATWWGYEPQYAQEASEASGAIERVNAGSLEVIGVAGLQDGKHVCTDRLHHVQFLVERPSWTMKSGAKQIGISFKESGIIFGKDALHAVRVDDL